jgi:hypothetical protein
LDDPAGAKAINERVQPIKALEGELASLPDEFDAEKLAGLKSKPAGDITRFREMMSDRRNASLCSSSAAEAAGRTDQMHCVPTERIRSEFAEPARAIA